MKITYVVHQFLPRYFTGTEQYVHAIASRFQGAGHDVEVFCLEPDFGDRGGVFVLERETVEGLSVVRVRFWRQLHRDWQRLDFNHPVMSERFGRYLEERCPDVVHVFHTRYLGADLLEETERLDIRTVVHLMDFWFLCPAVTLMKRDGSLCDGPPEGGLGCADCVDPWLAEQLDGLELSGPLRAVHEAGSPFPPGRSVSARAATLLMRPGHLARQLLRAQRILAPSRFLKEMFVHNGLPGERIDVVPYGVDTGVLVAARRDRDGGPVRVGFMGSLAPHKGVHLLVEAVRQVRGDLRLSIHGRTTDFPDYSRKIEEMAAGDSRVELCGPFPRAKLGEVLSGLDLLVLPSLWYENTPFVVLEAFAAGVPVLASDLGGAAEIVRDGINGELFRRGDAQDLAGRIQRVVEDPGLLGRYREGIREVKTVEAAVRELEAMYRGDGPS